MVAPQVDSGRVVWGVVMMTFGILLLGDRLALLDADVSGHVWPFVLIAVGGARLARTPETPDGHRAGGWLLFVGLWALAAELHVAGLDYPSSWPILVVGTGAGMVWRALEGRPMCGHAPRRGKHGA